MPPLFVQGTIADQMGVVMTAFGVLSALVARERTGIGQEVYTSGLGSMVWLQGLSVAMRLMLGFEVPHQAGNEEHQKHNYEKWKASNPRRVPGVRNKDV